MIRIRNLVLHPGEAESSLLAMAAKELKISRSAISNLQLRKRSIDARKKPDVRVIYTVDVQVKGDEAAVLRKAKNRNAEPAKYDPYVPPVCSVMPELRPVVVGFGPAGMFAALILAQAGLKPIVLERGANADTRKEKVDAFFSGGALDTASNVQFGEGGAGTFSDGKLNTGTSDRRIGYVLSQLARFGAGDDILIDAKPHVGTDVLIGVVKAIRKEIIALGGEVHFLTQVTGLETENGALSALLTNSARVDCQNAILALGHSARDTFEMLHEKNIPMEPKAFSMGVRIEHLQKNIDRSQYGTDQLPLPAADYKLSVHLPDGESAYTFCMCPGGYVVAAASEEGGVVTNGMSYSGRSGENANSALLVTLTPEDFPEGESPLRGMYFQREIEQAAFRAGGSNYHAPCQYVGDFLGRGTKGATLVEPTYRPGVVFTDLHEVLPKKITDTMEKALPELDRRLNGFADPGAVMTAPETRSSSPVRILRGADLQSLGVKGLYPCGEGAGYAGGIVSAAVDGIRCAEAMIEALQA